MRETSPLDQFIVQQLANGRYHRQDTLPLYFAESDPTHPCCPLVLLRSPYAGAKYGYLHQLWSRFLKLASADVVADRQAVHIQRLSGNYCL